MHGFSNRLKQLRKEKKLRQKDLAALLGVAQTTIANYEQNTRFPNERMLKQMADTFHVTLDYLLDSSITMPASVLPKENENSLDLRTQQYFEYILNGRREEALALVFNALKEGMAVREIYQTIFEKTLNHVGTLWEAGRIDIADEHFFSVTTEWIMSQLHPYLQPVHKKTHTAIAMAVGVGELHNIGIRMIADFLYLDGWTVYYLGGNLPNHSVIKVLEERRADLLAISTTMSYHVNSVDALIQQMKAESTLKGVRVMVGGAAFTQNPGLWHQVHADGFAYNAEEAVSVANALMGEP